MTTTTARYTAPEPPSVGAELEDLSSLVGFIAQAGPPPFIAGGALVFGSLMLAGPFAVAVTLLVAMALVAVSVALLAAAVAAIVAAPYVLLRRARRYHASHPFRITGHRALAPRAMAPSRIQMDAAASVVGPREPLA
jgi:hypothetical protein